MEIAELNRRLATLSPSERRYQRGETFDWEAAHRQTSLEGRPVYVMSHEAAPASTRHDGVLVVPDTPPLAGSVALRRNSRFNPVPEHVHCHIEISYVYAGTCPQTIDGRALTLQENQVLLLDTNCPHAIGGLGAGDIMMSLVLDRSFLRENLLDTFAHDGILSQFLVNALNDQADHNRCVRFHSEGSRRVRRYFQELMCEYFDPSSNADRITMNLLQLLFAELIGVYEADYQQRATAGGAVSALDLVRYIEQHYRDVTQEGVARHFAISPNYVSVLLKRHTGMTFMQAVQAQRLGHAASLLRNTDRPVEEVAHEVGYENLTFFYRKFRGAYGATPAAYRDEHRGHKKTARRQ